MSDEKTPQQEESNEQTTPIENKESSTNTESEKASATDVSAKSNGNANSATAESEKPSIEDEEKKDSSENNDTLEKKEDDAKEVVATDEEKADKTASSEHTNDAESTDDKKADASSDEEKGEDEDEDEIVSSDDDDEDEDEKEEKAQKDYSNLSKKALVTELEQLLKTNKIQNIKAEVEEIKTEFNNKFNEELEQKKEEFIADGGSIIDFHYTTPIKKEFNSLYFDYREKRNNHYRNLKKDLQRNLDKRWELIEELKGLLGAEENFSTTYKHFKEIQEKWHTAGPIPRDKYNTVWNTYHHHVENFYDYLHLNREFRDLDFKHNLDAKLKIITRAEELAQEKDVHKAFRELQMLHKMWKEDVGPVAKEYREEIWSKFSEITKTIHENRHQKLIELEAEYQKNFEKKKELISKIDAMAEPASPSHNTWQKAIKEVQKLRDAFFEIGRVPRAKNKEIWKNFKDVTRNFNRQKNSFYKNQKKQQYTNLEKKRELIKVAQEHKDSEDFETVTPLMKKIQEDWKHIGHVPRKDSDKIWKEFKKACNHYFDRLHAQKNKASQAEMDNYETKKEFLEKFSSLALTDDHNANIATIKSEIAAWKKIGRVPYNKRKIDQKFNKALDELFTKLDLGKKERELIKFDNKLNTLVNREDERKLRNEHFFISKKIQETQDEIRQLENNLGFFRHVDDDNPLLKEVKNNISRHKEQLEVWKAKLSKIKEIREE